MKNKKFHKAYEAAEYASSITNEWKDENDEIMNKEALLNFMSVADEEGDIDEEDEMNYYVVTPSGSIGYTNNGEKLINWIAKPTNESEETQDEKRPSGKVGYSDVINSPKFIEAVKKQKKSNRGCATVIILAPAIIFPIYLFFTGEDVIVGLGLGILVSVLFFVFGFLLTLKERFQNSWEGTVEKKYRKEFIDYRRDQNDINRKQTREYVIVREDNGKKHKIEEVASSTSRVYSYFKEGDRLCYHGKMGLLFPYEKYDKSKDEHVICAFCRRRVSITEDECDYCHRPLLK